MAARPDLDFLHQIAVSEADHRLLERIAADRARVLAGDLLAAPGEYLELTIDPDRAAGAAPGAPASSAGDSALAPLTLVLRADLAPASLDTIVEIFRDAAHAAVCGFRAAEVDSLVDVGANEGFYTLRMKRDNPALRVVAAEPVAGTFELLQRNLERNRPAGIGTGDVTTVRTAVAGLRNLSSGGPCRDRTIELDTYPHVSTVACRDLTSFPRPWIDPSRIGRERVPAMTLDGLLEAAGLHGADLLKLDVEGSEAEILADAASRGTLERFDRIVVECHGNAVRRHVRELVEAAGFDCVHAEGRRTGDLYFLRAGSAAR
jgi:FkbM family methyltransferase